MAYEAKTDLEDIGEERYYYLYVNRSYVVYHWDRFSSSLEQISSKFFIKLEDARAYARTHAREIRNCTSYKEVLKARIARLQQEIEQMED